MVADTRYDLPGHLLRRPLAWSAVAVLVLNDYMLKRAMPGEITGKLSDLAGLVLLPLALVSLAEAVRYVVRRPLWQSSVTELNGAVVLTAVGFAAVKLSTAVGNAYGYGLGAVRWLPDTVLSVSVHDAAPTFRAVAVSHDVTDLLALPILAIVLALPYRRART